jgi:hypothetical protein
MQRIVAPTLGPTDWRRLLHNPDEHWKRGHSALELAVAWESARRTSRGLPAEIARALDAHPDLGHAELLLAIPEHQVPIAGGSRASHNDLWGLLRIGDTIASLTVEAKAGGKLDVIVSEWLAERAGDEAKSDRLQEYQAALGIAGADASRLRCQLLHQAYSALYEARRFCAAKAILLVQSFNRLLDDQSWRDFQAFGDVMGVAPREGAFVRSPRTTGVPFYLGWVTSAPADVERLWAGV